MRTSFLTAAPLPDGYQELAEHIIQKAGESCGIQKKEELDIEWKAGRIIVTVLGSVYVSSSRSDDETSAEEEGENENETSAEEEGENENETREVTGVDIAQLAKAINFAMSEDEIGNAIAETHEFEVTTPGVSGT
jgi:hypothetical protein